MGGFHLFDDASDIDGDGGADHRVDRGGVALLLLRDANCYLIGGLWSDTRTSEPRNASDPMPLPPRQRVRRSTIFPRRRGAEIAPSKNGREMAPRKNGWEIAPRKNGGEDHLSDGEPAPLRQALRLRRDWELDPCKNGDEQLAEADPEPLRRPLPRGREIAPRKNGWEFAPRKNGWEFAPRKNGSEDHLSDGEPAPLRQALRLRRAWELDPCKNGDDHLAEADPAPLRRPLRCGREIAPRKNGSDGHLTDVDPAPVCQPLRRCCKISPRKNGGDDHLADADPDPVPLSQPRLRLWDANANRRKPRACSYQDIFREIMRQFRPGPVKHEKSWQDCMGFPMAQTVEGTCTLVACTVCVEAMHRVEYEARHGPGTFPCRAAAPRKLRRVCRHDGIWTEKGAHISDVLSKIRELGGVVTTNAAAPAPWVLPLRDWEKHGGFFGELSRLTMQRVAQLLDRGPCVASIWVYPWFWLCDSSSPDTDFVYRCSGMNQDFVRLSEMIYGEDDVSKHSVVCYAYRICGSSDPEAVKADKETADDDEMHVLVMDNQDTTGPSRWVDYKEFLDMYPVVVDRLEPPLHLEGRQIKYPRSGC